MDLLVYVFLAMALIVVVAKSIKQVPQSSVVLVERFGKYHRTLNAGLNVIVPFLDTLPHPPISISEQQFAIPNQNVTCADNVRVLISVRAFYRITDASRFTYRIEDGREGIRTTIDATVRALVGRRTLDQLNAERLAIAAELGQEVSTVSAEWGVDMSRVEIVDVSVVDQSFADSMRLESQKERERRGAIIEAEAAATAIRTAAAAEADRIRLSADASLYRAQKEAEAIKLIAEATAAALSVKGAVLETDGARFAQQSDILSAQVQALGQIGTADNSKLVVIPADLIQTAQSLSMLLANRK